MTTASLSLTEKETLVLSALIAASRANDYDFGLTSDVDFAALSLTRQGFAALFGSLLEKDCFEWTLANEKMKGGAPGSGTQFEINFRFLAEAAPSLIPAEDPRYCELELPGAKSAAESSDPAAVVDGAALERDRALSVALVLREAARRERRVFDSVDDNRRERSGLGLLGETWARQAEAAITDARATILENIAAEVARFEPSDQIPTAVSFASVCLVAAVSNVAQTVAANVAGRAAEPMLYATASAVEIASRNIDYLVQAWKELDG